jgi:hypothetical protein
MDFVIGLLLVRDFTASEIRTQLGYSQNHPAVAGGCEAFFDGAYGVPTRYREVVLTVSKHVA